MKSKEFFRKVKQKTKDCCNAVKSTTAKTINKIAVFPKEHPIATSLICGLSLTIAKLKFDSISNTESINSLQEHNQVLTSKNEELGNELENKNLELEDANKECDELNERLKAMHEKSVRLAGAALTTGNSEAGKVLNAERNRKSKVEKQTQPQMLS